MPPRQRAGAVQRSGPVARLYGFMDKALVFGTKDCRFESCQSHIWTKPFALFTAAPCVGRSTKPPTYAIATPVGYEPTRGDAIGLTGGRLNHSAKVSLQASGLRLHAGAAFLARSSGAACLRAVGRIDSLLRVGCGRVHSSVVRTADCK